MHKPLDHSTDTNWMTEKLITCGRLVRLTRRDTRVGLAANTNSAVLLKKGPVGPMFGVNLPNFQP